jgi:hypothetical protein
VCMVVGQLAHDIALSVIEVLTCIGRWIAPIIACFGKIDKQSRLYPIIPNYPIYALTFGYKGV